jgi:hypothetical protein
MRAFLLQFQAKFACNTSIEVIGENETHVLYSCTVSPVDFELMEQKEYLWAAIS